MEIAHCEVFSAAEKAALQLKLKIEEGDCVFFRCGQMGKSLVKFSGGSAFASQKCKSLRLPLKPWIFLWVTDFPCLNGARKKNKWNAMHHPFTRPKAEDMSLFNEKNFPDVRAEAYDVV